MCILVCTTYLSYVSRKLTVSRSASCTRCTKSQAMLLSSVSKGPRLYWARRPHLCHLRKIPDTRSSGYYWTWEHRVGTPSIYTYIHITDNQRKSQIAIEYCYQFSTENPTAHIFWIHASTTQRVSQAYKEIGRRLLIPGCNNPKANPFKLLADWLSDDGHGPWLMVVDNADDLEMFISSESNNVSDNAATTINLIKFLPQS